MPDISMCTTEGCPQAAKCYRKTAKWDLHWQSVSPFPFNADGSCDHFMEQPKPLSKRELWKLLDECIETGNVAGAIYIQGLLEERYEPLGRILSLQQAPAISTHVYR